MSQENDINKVLKVIVNLEENLDMASLTAIEKDIVMSKVRSLYEKIIQTPSVIKEAEPVTNIIENIDIKPEEITIEPAKEEVIQEVKVSAEQEKPVIEVKEEVIENITIEEVKKTDSQTSSNTTASTLSDKFMGSHLSTIGEMINNMRSQSDLTSRLSKSPITNLKNAISINDRIMFTKDLFKGNSELFHSTIDEINKLSQLDEALELISGKIELDMQNPNLEKFMEILYRRFVTTDNSLK